MPTSPPAAPARYLNRELSWLEFNQRVLDEALNPATPLLERMKFFCITSSNLDEFFEVRVASLKQEIEDNVNLRTPDGRTPAETLREVTIRVRRLVDDAYRCWREQLLPALAKNRIRFLDAEALREEDREWSDNYYRAKVHPVLTPLAIDPSHPFPQLLNKSLNLVARLTATHTGEVRRRLAVVQVPRVLPRLVRLPRAEARQHDYLFLADLIGDHLADLFPGTQIEGWWTFRVTRNSELYIDEEEVPNLLKAVENELHNRRKGDAVRLEVAVDCPADIRAELLETFSLAEHDLYVIDGPLNPTRLMAILDGDHAPELHDPRFVGPVAAGLRGRGDLFAAIRERDHLLHHPYESFNSVVEFLEQAAADPKVLAIKQTLYRTGGDQRIIGALMNAVTNGKQVTAVVELKARFDEANNIRWARALEEAGVHVVYGLVGYKIHCKLALVVRADDDGIRRYVHVGTGNYNPSTAKLYTDLSLLTCRPAFGEDATNLFNLLTGICQFQGTRKFVVAHFQMHDRILELIAREITRAEAGLPARIVVKMNALVEEQVIEALYRASRAGVKIDLIIRGICCLRPGVPGLSENITVRSIVDRFLEHSRIWWFENGRQPEVFVGSADWMPRNLFRRIEVVFPVEDGNLRDRITEEILGRQLSDNVKARHLRPDGTYVTPPLPKGAKPRRSQSEFMELASATSQPKPGKNAKPGPIALRKRPK
ncbi:MAG TPA: polyphosphate kinase 1 [Candidatus Limnocylindria bacterium]|nr:polyphosphate kinase 1 [Candidatus Limnocylindria bacterium]